MKKRTFLMMTSVVMAGIFMASCGSGNDMNDDSAVVTGNKEEIKLVGWSTTPQEKEFVQDRIDAFEAEHSDIKVDFEVIQNEYNDTLQIQIASGKGPDVFYLDANWSEKFIDANTLAPIDEYLKDGTVEDFYPSTLESFQKDGNVYGLTKDMNTLVMYYDAGAFEKHNKDIPTTWEELEETAKYFAEQDEYEAGIVLRTDLPRFLPFIFQANGEIVDEDGNPTWVSEEVANAFDFYFNTLIKTGIAKTPEDFGGENEGAMTSGKVPMMLSGGWATEFMKENAPDMDWKMTKLPKGEKESSVIFTVAYVMNKNTKNPEATAKFIEFMTSKKAQEMVVDSGLAVPTRVEVADYYAEKNPDYKANTDQVENSKVFALGPEGAQIAELLTTAGEKIRLQDKDPMEALEEAKAEFETYLETK